jgi:predicted DNA-binding transcriptional regulator AlpA
MRPAHKTFHADPGTAPQEDPEISPQHGTPKKRSAEFDITQIHLLDEHEVSRRLSVSVNTLRYWRACGEGPNYVKLGRLVRYDAKALEKFILRNLRVSKARATAEEKRVAL